MDPLAVDDPVGGRYVRHPSYTGMLLAVTGLGVALDDWLSLLALTMALGEEYRESAAGTRRLVPGVW